VGARAPTAVVPMSLAWALPSGATAHVRFTDAADGDFAVGQPAGALAARREALVPLPWTWLHQVHGDRVVVVDEPGKQAGAHADAAVTARPGAALAIQAADCAPVALVADEGVVAAVHVGWRGLVAGVVERAVEAVHRAGGSRLRAVVGPCIHACCYEFGAADLDRVAARYGDGVRATTRSGRPALDLPAAVTSALSALSAQSALPAIPSAASATTGAGCTACGTPPMFSHRARGDTARQAMVVWLEDPTGGPATR
jgi:purine-nucleoside/S-methyl-5'-thioadenosine phosphorylase / adenosine deaminase